MKNKVKNYTIAKWTVKELFNIEDLFEVQALIHKGFNIGSLDTETTGLHIILDKAFCISLTIVNKETSQGKAYSIYLPNKDETFIQILQETILLLKVLVFWNTKFDLHMLENAGLTKIKKHQNITDAMIYARLANDAIPTSAGGVDLRLKAYSVKMLDSDAKDYEREVASYKREIATLKNQELKKYVNNLSLLKERLNDKIDDLDDLPPEIYNILKNPNLDQNNYKNIPWDVLRKYAAFDAIFTIENYLRDKEIVRKREQIKIALMEEKLIPILWEMERIGFKLNSLYLHQSRYVMKKYIYDQRDKLEEVLGEPIKIGQHAKIKEIFARKFGIHLDKADEDSLKESMKKTSLDPERSKKAAELIIELRTLEKWYATYICKWDEYTDRTDRIYTSFKQTGTVSGRFACDFQQFPKEPIYKDNGEILYSPRKIVSVSGGEYDTLCLIDYAAEELRIQALYTILINKPDLNLCRAFIPMETIEKNGKFYLKENPEQEWVPTDLHSLTTLKAFPELKPTDPDFGHYRKIGKSTNFACNYNASKKTLITQFGFSEDLADRLYNAYTSAYPGIAEYRNYVKEILRHQPYATNLFGRRYYGCSWHNAANYLIQGSAADLLKLKLIELYDFIKTNNYKSRILCTIHDEIMFEIHKDEHHIIPKLKEIMENVPNSKIPFVAEVSLTNSTWDMKKEI